MRSVLPIVLVGCTAGVLAAYTWGPEDVGAHTHPRAMAAELVGEAAPRSAVAGEVSPAGAAPPAELDPLPADWTELHLDDAPRPIPEPLLAAPPPPTPQPPLHQGAPFTWPAEVSPGSSDALRASAYAFNAQVYSAPRPGSPTLAVVRRGGLLEITGSAKGRGCKQGRWFAVAPKGYVCTRRGFGAYDWDKRFGHPSDAPDVTRGRPYRYGKLTQQGAPRLRRVPSEREWAQVQRAIEHDGRLPKIAVSKLEGAYFLALAAEETQASGTWLHTVRGQVLPRDAVERLPLTRMRGVHLEDGRPVAFVITEDAPVLDAASFERIGRAERYARFAIEDHVERDGTHYLRAPGDRLIVRKHLRRVRRVNRPRAVGPSDRWVHVDLSEQVLVAYEGDQAVYATLVSSGIPGHATPRGLFRVGEKHITATMRGPDPDMGVYEVEEVPWTQYFHYSYAVHGAYWHDGFGAVRSHGCVNLPPDDARWLFEWTSPDMPSPWHGRRHVEGTWIYTTG